MMVKSREELEYERRWEELKNFELKPVELEGQPLPGEFKGAFLDMGSALAGLNAVMPNTVTKRAVDKLQENIKSGSTVPIFNRHFFGVRHIVGLAQAIWLEGDQVYFNGRFLCSEKAQEIAGIPNKVFRMFGDYKFSETRESEIVEVRIRSIGVYPKVELIH